MLGTKSSIIIILFFITFISSTLIIPTTSQTQFQANIRYLQINSPTTKTIQQQLNKTIEYANSYRVDNKLSSITLNSNAARILNQWQTIMKSFMSLQQYFQLYGIMNVYFQVFTSIPEDYVSKVIVKLSQGLIYGTYNQYALYYRELDAGNKQITFVFLGGPEAKNNKISEDLIGKTIQDIKLQEDQANKLTAQAQTPSVVNTQPQTPTVVNTQPQTPSVVNTQPQTPSVVNTQPQTPSVVNTQPQTPSVVNTQPQTPSVVNTQPQTPSVVNTRPQTPSTVNTQPQTPSVVNTQPQTPSVVNTQPQTPSVVNTQPQTPSVVNTQPQTPSTVNTQPQTPSVVNTQPQTPSVVNTQPQTSSSLTTSSISSSTIKPSNPNIYITNNPQQISQVFIKSPSILSSQFPLLPSPIIQTTFCNTTYYPNIILSHCLPKSFLKDEIFPFRGKITVPNPTGMSVNVIYTRVSDQLRLAFSQYLRPNNTSFQILAELNMTGNYYLSVFVGRSGIAAANTFTISPSFIGSIVSRAPSAIKSASLNLMNNDLWLNWTYSDVSQPAITQIIFTQDGGKKKEFLISNYQTEFKIPFSHFYDFYSGTTDIQITQAFSSNQSAISRTSFFSAPYSLIFTATTHHYDIIKKNDFDPIPLKINQKNFITLSGTTSTDMQNQIVILTPDKKFVSQYINPKNQSQKIKAGTKLNVSIQFNTTGVHILQVNDAGGQAIINVPIYVGDIIPLIPDFMDLNPKYIDLQALNQPTLLDTRRSIILMLLNDVRRSFGQSNLYLDNKLNDLAQSYSATQIQYNFVGHYDMMGRGPGQRAEAAGILEGVGENIAVNNNLTNAQLMLQRSPIHLRNMVSPLWTRVGLGIVQNPNQMYYLTQQFSSRDLTLNPLTSSEISAIQGQILNFITNKYPNITGEDKGLSSRLSSYQNLSSRPYIITYLNGFGYKNFGVANVKASYNNGDYMQLITNGSNFEPTSTSFKLVGISVTYSDGSLEIFAAYI